MFYNQISLSVVFNSSNCLIVWRVGFGRPVGVCGEGCGGVGMVVTKASTSTVLRQKVKNA